MRPHRLASCLAFGLALLGAAVADADWPQWRGPNRDGQALGVAPPEAWPKALRPVWSIAVGDGHATPLVGGERVYVFARQGEEETVTAYALADGAMLWRDTYPQPYRPTSEAAGHRKGPFATPVLADGRLFTFGIDEVLSAYDAVSGKRLWRRDFSAVYAVPRPYYGTSWSPLVADGKLVVYVGGPGDGALLALDPATGGEIWRAVPGADAGASTAAATPAKGVDGPPYASPVLLRPTDGQDQILTQTQTAVVGVELATGRLLWRIPYQVDWDNTIVTPAVAGGQFFLSAYDHPLESFRVDRETSGWRASSAWSNREAGLYMSSPVLTNGAVWAFTATKKGQIVQVDPTSGAIRWRSAPGQGEHASLVSLGNQLLVLRDDGHLTVVDTGAADRSPQVVAELEVASSPSWAHPVPIAGGLLIRDAKTLTRFGY
jgi:outer membrane protein assembly factor BamB